MVQEEEKQILEKITPTEEERRLVYGIAEEVRRRVEEELRALGVEAEVRVEGSVAKDTWLRGDADIDIFSLLPPETPKEFLKTRFLDAARKATKGYRQVERWAEHPYLECTLDGIRLNIVPCYKTRPGKWISATDRTPYHTEYVLKRLNEGLKAEIRLLKAFMKGIGCYGAEIRIGGFSGYLCELLTLNYGGFRRTLEEASEWRPPILIDIEGYYEGHPEDALELFQHPIIVVDPVDEARNAASAVKPKRLWEFVSAARQYLKKPSQRFFFPREKPVPKPEQVRKKLLARGTSHIALAFRPPKAPPDILWGQLFKAEQAVCRFLKRKEYRVLRSACWSDEEKQAVLVYELESRRLPAIKRHVGPPVWMTQHSQQFLEKYLGNKEVATGPVIEEDRWVVYLKTGRTDAKNVLKRTIGKEKMGIPKAILESMKKTLKIHADEEICILCENAEFSRFLNEFLVGRPSWLEHNNTSSKT